MVASLKLAVHHADCDPVQHRELRVFSRGDAHAQGGWEAARNLRFAGGARAGICAAAIAGCLAAAALAPSAAGAGISVKPDADRLLVYPLDKSIDRVVEVTNTGASQMALNYHVKVAGYEGPINSSPGQPEFLAPGATQRIELQIPIADAERWAIGSRNEIVAEIRFEDQQPGGTTPLGTWMLRTKVRKLMESFGYTRRVMRPNARLHGVVRDERGRPVRTPR